MNEPIQDMYNHHTKNEHMKVGCTQFADSCPFCETFVREQRPAVEERIKAKIIGIVKWHTEEANPITQDRIADRIAQFMARNMMDPKVYREEPVSFAELVRHPIVRMLLGTH